MRGLKPSTTPEPNGKGERPNGHEQPPKATPRLWLADLSISQPVFITMVILALGIIAIIS